MNFNIQRLLWAGASLCLLDYKGMAAKTLGWEGGLRGEADVCGGSGGQAGRRLKGSAEQFSAGARPRLVLSSST